MESRSPFPFIGKWIESSWLGMDYLPKVGDRIDTCDGEFLVTDFEAEQTGKMVFKLGPLAVTKWDFNLGGILTYIEEEPSG